MAKIARILAIDGGGIRGIIPALVMAEIEKRTGRRISALFDLIAGTSTGGVLALGITKPGPDGKPQYRAEDGVGFYVEEGPKIFSRSVWHRLRSAGSMLDERYPAQAVEDALDRYFGEARLKEALTDVLITSYEIERRIPWFFRSRRARLRPDYDFPMKQVVRATSAAPTYFEPCRIEADGAAEYYALIDGGVFANNPAMCAYVDALSQDDTPPTEVLVVSLGTGQLTRPYYYDQARNWGLLGWAQPVVNILMHGVNETVHYQMQQVLSAAPGGRQRYYRFQVRLDEGSDDMDDAGRTNLRVLKLLAEELIHQRSGDLDALCADLLRLSDAG